MSALGHVVVSCLPVCLRLAPPLPQQRGTTIEVYTSAVIVSVSIQCTTSARNLRKNPLVDQCTPVRIIQASVLVL
jgi:hypothetical protein